VVYSNVVYCPNVVGWRSGMRQRRLCVRCEGCCSSNIPHTEHSATTQQTESNLYEEKDGLEKRISRFFGVSTY
jgi:hypothetical protein